MMKCSSATTLIIALALCATSALAASVSLEPAGASPRQVKVNDFSTVGFRVVNNLDSAQNFKMSVATPPGVTLVGSSREITLMPAEEDTIPLTFFVSEQAREQKSVVINASLTSTGNPPVSAGASIPLEIITTICALISDTTGKRNIQNQKPSDIMFSITNCGDSNEKFDIAVVAGFGLELRDAPREVSLGPGTSKTLSLSVFPTNHRASYDTSVRITVSSNRIPAADADIQVSVNTPAPIKTSSSHQYIPLNLFFENTLDRNNDLNSRLRISVPLMKDGQTSLESDVWMDSHNGSKYEPRQQYVSIAHKDARMIAGDQQIPMPESLHNRYESYDGRMFSHSLAGGSFSYFSGVGGMSNVSLARWDKGISKNWGLGLGRVVKSDGTGEYRRLSANSLHASWSPNGKISLNTEIVKFHVAGGRLLSDHAGMSYRLGGGYETGNFKITGFKQTGDDNIASSSFSSGSELRVDYSINDNRHVYIDLLDHTSHRLAVSQTRDAHIPYRIRSSAIGYSQPFLGGTSLFASFNRSMRQTPAAGSGGDLSEDRALSFRLSKHFSNLNLYFERQTGDRRDARHSTRYGENRYSVMYTRNRFSLGLEQGDASGFDDSAFKYATHNFGATLYYAAPDNNNSFQLSWTKYDSWNEIHNENGDKQTRLGIQYNTIFHNGDTLRISYETVNSGDVASSALRLIVSKTIGIKIPYLKYGSISGMVYEDHNRNGLFDPGEIPVENVLVKAGKGYSAKTGADGKYYIVDMQSGEYEINIESGSIPGGFSPAPGILASVRSAQRIAADFPLRKSFRIGGRVIVDRSDYLTAETMPGPGQIRMILIKEGRVVDSAFTESNGSYYFENVGPGDYHVAVDPEWLPAGVEVFDYEQQPVHMSGDSDAIDINFTIGPRRVPLSITRHGTLSR